MKLIYIWVDGLRYFESQELEIDFALQKMVRRTNIPIEVNEVLVELFLPNTIALVGLNGAGKSMIINIIDDITNFIFNKSTFNKTEIYNDEIMFEAIYLIDDELVDIDVIIEFKNGTACVKSQKIFKKKYLKTYYVNDYLYTYSDEELIYNSVKFEDCVNTDCLNIEDKYLVYIPVNFHKSIKINEMKVFEKYLENILNIIDSGIDKFTINNDEMIIEFKNGTVINGGFEELEKRLSSGTYFGLWLFVYAMISLKNGSIMIVDNLSSKLNKLVVEELLNLFQDKFINRSFATIMFATNYIEIIDNISRADCIHLVEKKHGTVVNNLSKFIERNEKSKSKCIYGNTKISVRTKKEMKNNLINIFEEDNE